MLRAVFANSAYTFETVDKPIQKKSCAGLRVVCEADNLADNLANRALHMLLHALQSPTRCPRGCGTVTSLDCPALRLRVNPHVNEKSSSSYLLQAGDAGGYTLYQLYLYRNTKYTIYVGRKSYSFHLFHLNLMYVYGFNVTYTLSRENVDSVWVFQFVTMYIL